MSSMEISNLTKEKLKNMIAEGKRFDSRGLLDLRDVEISYGVSKKAEGSARVKIGKTEVVVGVKLQTGEPYPDSPDKGNLMASGDLLPLASPRFESGPPGFNAIELPRLIDRAIRASGMIDFSKLVIKKGELVWTVIIDIYPINDDGNLIDAASMGAVAALKQTVFPETDKDGKINYEKRTSKKLPLSKEISPISFSFFKLGDSIILDPTREEEEACDARITFGISKWNGQYMLNSCQKKGEAPLTQEDVAKMMDIIPKKFEELIKKLETFIS
ncbi:MAG: exosome complex protein Rrp42 [Nanoarchaeota archaeon]|nr:exosome complex protein Rrp42 [Nanoarchaeota archaeon]MBU1051790.1 exosome complex protein Rrp42 [Nanoarchaeota archaeon]